LVADSALSAVEAAVFLAALSGTDETVERPSR
jgi:hypothetical protein